MALKKLNAEHYIAIGELALPKAMRKTTAEIAELAGVSERSIFNWKNVHIVEK